MRKRTSLSRHEVLGFVLTVVQAAGQDDIIIVALQRQMYNEWAGLKIDHKVPFNAFSNLEIEPQREKKQTDLLPRSVLAAESDGLQRVSSAGERSDAGIPRLKGLFQKHHCHSGSFLHLLDMGVITVSLTTVLSFCQAVQLCDHWVKDNRNVKK